MWWEQLILFAHCTVGVFFVMAENEIFDDEMNSFGSISVVGCFVWLLFAIELTDQAIWLLPLLSMCCLIPSEMLMIRYGHPQTTKDDEGKPTGVRNVIDGDFASHFVYFAVGVARCEKANHALFVTHFVVLLTKRTAKDYLLPGSRRRPAKLNHAWNSQVCRSIVCFDGGAVDAL